MLVSRGPHERNMSRDAVQYSVLPSRGYPQKLRSAWRTVFQRHSYSNAQMERLYAMFVYRLQLERLRRLVGFLVLYTTLVCVLHFVFTADFTLENVFYLILVAFFLLLLFILHTRYAAENRITVFAVLVLFLCFGLSVMSLPATLIQTSERLYSPADGVWNTLLVIFIIYTMLPLRNYIAVPCGVLLSVLHTLVACFYTERHDWLIWRHVSSCYF